MPAARIEAVVFDLDGTLIDTETVYRAAFMQAAASLGLVMPSDVYETLVGVASPERRARLFAAFGPGFPADAFFEAYYARRETLLPERIPERPGAAALLRVLRLPKAVATSASRRTAEAHLRRCGFARHFEHVVTRDDVTSGKPAPDAYLRAAELLGTAPDRCLAVEDSPNGAASARAAGMPVVMLAPRAADFAAVAELIGRPEPRRRLFVGDFVNASGTRA